MSSGAIGQGTAQEAGQGTVRKIVDFFRPMQGRERLAAFVQAPPLIVNHGVLGAYGNALSASELRKGMAKPDRRQRKIVLSVSHH